MEAYYNIIQQKERVAFLNTIILFYEERLKITEERWQVGQGSKLDYLQSKTDLNVQLSEMVGVKNNLKNTKVILNGLLNREPSEDFDVEDVNNSESEYILAELKKIATEKNRDLMLLQKALHISQKQEEEREALLKPEVILNGNVGFAYSNTNAGFFLSNRSLSATAGVSARWNLIDGKHRKTQIAIAKVNTEIIEKEQESLEAQIFTDLTFAYNQYESDKELVAFEKENKLVAEENLSISIEKFRLGGSTILELSEAQRAYDTALNRLVNAQYNIKISELELLRLSGVLVQ
jgi:outer membrane protein TolC